jgi:hypothetical protein
MRLHDWGGCVMAEINAVLAGLTAEELEETSQLGGRGTWGGNLIDALDRSAGGSDARKDLSDRIFQTQS